MTTEEPRSREDAVAVDCGVCGMRFDDRDRLVDHLENSHSLISNTVERNSRLVFGDSDAAEGGRAPGDRS